MTVLVFANTYTTAGELAGVLLASYGLIRESFADLTEKRDYGEGRFGEGPYGGAPSPSWFTRGVLRIATAVRLLPPDHTLTLTDRQRNAVLAIAGTGVAVAALIVELALGGAP